MPSDKQTHEMLCQSMDAIESGLSWIEMRKTAEISISHTNKLRHSHALCLSGRKDKLVDPETGVRRKHRKKEPGTYYERNRKKIIAYATARYHEHRRGILEAKRAKYHANKANRNPEGSRNEIAISA